MQGSRALPTHLAEAAKAEQCRFVERKVSHCRRQERGSVSLGRVQPQSLKQCPLLSVRQALVVWPSMALVGFGLPLLSYQLPQVP